MGKIKVLHIITRFDKGGSAENTFLTISGLDKKKYDVILIMGPSQESHMSEQEAIAVKRNLVDIERKGVRIFTLPELVRNIAPVQDFKAFLKLFGIFKSEKPRLVHTHTSKAGILGRWAAFFAKVPIIVHTPHGHVFWGYFNKWKAYLFIVLERLTAHITDKIIMLTKRELNDHLDFKIAPENKFIVIHSGVDFIRYCHDGLNPLAIKTKIGIPNGRLVVGTVGRLTHVKGHKYLVQAASNLLKKKHDTIFVFLGDGELLGEITEMANVLGIKDHFMFLGWRPDVADIMSTFDIFVMPSLNEGMGKVLIEAMALGKPIIASNVGGIPDIVIDSENGVLVPPENPDFLARAIEDLVNDPLKRKIMGEKGKMIATGFGFDAMIQKIDCLYDELIYSHE